MALWKKVKQAASKLRMRHGNGPDGSILAKPSNPSNSQARPPQLALLPFPVPSILKLGDDVLTQVLEYLYALDEESVRIARLISTTFYRLAVYVSSRSVKLDLTTSTASRRLEHLAKQSFLRAIRYLEVIAVNGDKFIIKKGIVTMHHGEISSHARLCELLPLMTGLREIRWSILDFYPVMDEQESAWEDLILPQHLSELSRSAHHVRLHITIWETWSRHTSGSKYVGCLLGRLRNNKHLHSLKLQYTWHGATSCGALKQVLLSSPNLKELCLHLRKPFSPGRPLTGAYQEYCGMGFRNGEKLPPLERLDLYLDSFKFFYLANDRTLVSSPVSSIEIYEEKPEIDYWVDTFDWTQLKSLTVSDEDFVFRFLPKLRALEEVHQDRLEPWVNFDIAHPNVSIGYDPPQTFGNVGVIRIGWLPHSFLKLQRYYDWLRNSPTWVVINAASLRSIHDQWPYGDGFDARKYHEDTRNIGVGAYVFGMPYPVLGHWCNPRGARK